MNRLLRLLLAVAAVAGLMLASGVSTGATRVPARRDAAASGRTATNGRIAFADNRTGQIYAINPDGTGLSQLTHVRSGGFAVLPAWSPDGRHIAFEKSNKSGHLRIWTMDADGSHKRLVAHDRANVYDLSAKYTPDGRRLVFSRLFELGDGFAAQIASIRVDGRDRRELTRLQPPPTEAFDFDPAVSPDGRWVAISRFNGNVNGRLRQLYLMRIDGSHLHPILRSALEGFSPAWSPNGRRITFSSNAARPGSNIYVMRSTGGHVRRLTREPWPHNAFESTYSPDGRRIVFDGDRRYADLCCTDLFVMNADGTHRTRIDTGLEGAAGPSWGTAPPVTGAAPRVRQPVPTRPVWPKRLWPWLGLREGR